MRLIDPMPTDRRPARVALLLAGLVVYGASVGMMLQAGLGQMPWGVLDQGLAGVLGIEVGTGSILVGAVVLLLWLPLHRRPGLGTLCNVVLVGLSINATLAVLPAPDSLGWRIPLLLAGVLVNGLATGAYIGAGLGAGPRDGLTTGIAARGHSVRVVRTTIEVLVLAVGWLLGGTVGVGTLLYALAIGPLVHRTMPAFELRRRLLPTGPLSAAPVAVPPAA
ncbi:membrane protein YczE [Modestobacter versicolor]|uniref:membrane protein YczE n=1 Tax=Modestobacter versicolor TaxID=429133 RepID=UPI0034DFA22E